MPEACNWKELLRVARWKTRSALRENRHFSRGQPEEVPASSRARENCQRASGHSATCPGLSLDDIAPRKHGTCFGSSIRKFEAGSGTSIRIERTHVRCVLRVEPRVDSRNMSAIPHNRELGRAFGKSTRFWALLRVGQVKTASVLRVIRLLARGSPWTILLRENTELALARAFGNLKLGRERAYGSSVRTSSACSESSRESTREI